jgi:GT2 family glycosyltransferase
MTQKDKIEPTIAAVVVTRNRVALLKEGVAALQNQTRKLDEIIVIDNSSDDGTADWLKEQTGLTVVRQANVGSSGGQYTGIKTAYEKGHGWIWCMDDDTVPERDALEKLAASPYFKEVGTGLLASLVVWTDGTPHRMNTPATVATGDWARSVLQDRCVRVGAVSFVSVMFSRQAVAEVGLPIWNMFLWFDDTEYTSRITRQFNGYLVLDSIAVHKTKTNAGAGLDRVGPADRVKYLCSVRNWIYVIKTDKKTPLWRKFMRMIEHWARHLRLVLTGRAPVSTIGWLAKGTFTRPRIDRV